MWQLATSPVPPPRAAPWTAGDQGLGEARTDGEELLLDGIDLVGVAAPVSWISARSMPAQKALPLAVSRMAPIAGSAAACVERVDEGAAEGGIKGVALLGTIEGESQKASLANGMQNVGHCAQVGGRFTARSTPLA